MNKSTIEELIASIQEAELSVRQLGIEMRRTRAIAENMVHQQKLYKEATKKNEQT